MANWTQLIGSITDNIKENDNQEITGTILQGVLKQMVEALGATSGFKGIAVPDTSPLPIDGTAFYIATEAGTYANLGGTTIASEGIYIFEYKDGAWTSYPLLVDNKTEYYNVTTRVPPSEGTFYSLSTAIAAIESQYKKIGFKATFEVSANIWQSYQFIGSSISTWATTSNWKLVSVSGLYGNISISTDLNTISQTGDYTCYGTASNVPSASYSWFIEHRNSGVGIVYAYQRAIAYSTEIIIYERTKISSTWGTWKRQSGGVLATTGSSETSPMSQKAVTDELNDLEQKVGETVDVSYIASTSGSILLDIPFKRKVSSKIRITIEDTNNAYSYYSIYSRENNTDTNIGSIGASKLPIEPILTADSDYIRIYSSGNTGNGGNISVQIKDVDSILERLGACENKNTQQDTSILNGNKTLNILNTQINGLDKIKTASATAGSPIPLSALKTDFELEIGTIFDVLLSDNSSVINQKTYTLYALYEDGSNISINSYDTQYGGLLPNRKSSYIVPFKIYGIEIYISGSDVLNSGEISLSAKIEYNIENNISTINEKEIEQDNRLNELTANMSGMVGLSDSVNQDALYARKYIESECPYYLATSANPATYTEDNYIEQCIQRVPKDGVHFIFFTDTHQQGAWAGTHITPLVDYVKKRIGIKNVVFGGDIFDVYKGDENNAYLGAEYQAASGLGKYASEYFTAFGEDLLWVEGNHDANSPGHGETANKDATYLIPSYQSYLRTTRNLEGKVVFNDEAAALMESAGILTGKDLEEFKYWCKKTYYTDDIVNKTRYLVVELGNYGVTVRDFDSSVVWTQIDFIYGCLINTPSDYNLVVLGHQFGRGDIASPAYYRPSLIIEMLSMYKSKQSFDFTPWETTRHGGDWWAAKHGSGTTTVNYDFTHIIPAKKIICLGGHYHCDASFIGIPSGLTDANNIVAYTEYPDVVEVPTNGILLVWNNRSAYNASYEATISGLNHAKTWVMDENSVTEHSFDVITIQSDKVIFTRFGSGEDRIFNY